MDRGAKQILETFPYLTKEQAEAALRKNRLDITRTMTWMVSQDEISLLTSISALVAEEEEKKKKQESSAAPNIKPIKEFPEYQGIVEFLKFSQNTTDTILIYRIESVNELEGIKLRCAFDRNGVTMHPGYSPNYVLPLPKFLSREGEDFKIFTPEENQRVMRDLRNRMLTITYQSLDKTDFSPISVTPEGLDLFADYKVVFDERLQKLSKVYHRTDGPVLFTGEKDRGEFGLWDGEPIQIYTIAHSDNTHRLVHMHINDIRTDVTVDAVNITGTGQTVEEMNELKKDTSGRLLSYRIVVNKGMVEAVFHHSGRTKRAKFVEETVPPIGSLVTIRGGGMATLQWAPAGLVVSSDTKSGVGTRQEPFHKKAHFCQCGRKHPMELPGLVDVRLEQSPDGHIFPEIISHSTPTTDNSNNNNNNNGNNNNNKSGSGSTPAWGAESQVEKQKANVEADAKRTEGEIGRYVAIPVCCVSLASDAQRDALGEMRRQVVEERRKELATAMDTLEASVKSLEKALTSQKKEAKNKDQELRDAEGKLTPDIAGIDSLRTKVAELRELRGMEDVVDEKRFKAVDRAMRFIAFQRRALKRASSRT